MDFYGQPPEMGPVAWPWPVGAAEGSFFGKAGGEGESSSLLRAGVLAAPLSGLSALPLPNPLYRRASSLNRMILIKIIKSSSES